MQFPRTQAERKRRASCCISASISPSALALHQSVMMHVDQTRQKRGGGRGGGGWGAKKSDISMLEQKRDTNRKNARSSDPASRCEVSSPPPCRCTLELTHWYKSCGKDKLTSRQFSPSFRQQRCVRYGRKVRLQTCNLIKNEHGAS